MFKLRNGKKETIHPKNWNADVSAKRSSYYSTVTTEGMNDNLTALLYNEIVS